MGNSLNRTFNLTKQLKSSFMELQVTEEEPGVARETYSTNSENSPENRRNV